MWQVLRWEKAQVLKALIEDELTLLQIGEENKTLNIDRKYL